MMGHRDSPPGKGRESLGSTRSPAHDQGLSRRRRLTRTSQFRETYAQGNRVVGRYMVLWQRRGDDASLRLGVVASRKVGNAVKRALAKRRLREVFRRNRHRCSGEVDVVLVARRAIVTADWNAIVEEFLRLTERAGLSAESRQGEEEEHQVEC